MTQREIIKLVEDYIGTTGGYLNGFSYSIHDTFYHQWCDLDIDVSAYRARGLTTLKAFIQILKDSEARAQAKIIRGIFDMIPPPEQAGDDQSKKRLAVHKELLSVAARLEADGQVDTPVIQHTIEVVFEALKDAEALLKTRGPKSAVDRAHTALHGYLKRICQNRGIGMPSDPTLTAVFKVLREQLPEFSVSFR